MFNSEKFSELFHFGKKFAFSSTARSTYFVFIGNILSAFFSFIFTVVLVRLLSLEDFGYFSALMALLVLVNDFSDIGIGSTLSAFLPPLNNNKNKEKEFLRASFLIQAGIALLILIIVIALSSPLTSLVLKSSNLEFLLLVTAVGIFFSILGNFTIYTISARQQFKLIGLLAAIGGFLRLGFLLILVILESVNLTNVVIIQTIQIVFMFVLGFLLVGPSFIKGRFYKSDLKTIFSFSYLLGIGKGLSAIASRLDVLMIIALIGPVEAGIYSIASRVISIYLQLAGSFTNVIAPKLSTIFQKEKLYLFIKKVNLAILLIIGTIIFFIIISKPFMTLLFADKGTISASTFKLLLIAMIFFVPSILPISVAIYNLKKPYIFALSSLLQLIIIAGGNLYLLPKFGRFGAAYSLIAAYGITLVITYILTLYYLIKK